MQSFFVEIWIRDYISLNLHNEHKVWDNLWVRFSTFYALYCRFFPTDVNENRRHIHVIRRGNKKSHKGHTVAKIWIEEMGQKKIEIEWSELSSDENKTLIEVIDQNYSAINERIDNLFNGRKVDILKINKIIKK